MALKMFEQEVVINYNRAEGTAIVYSSDPVTIRKLDKLAKSYPLVTVKEETKYSKTYIIPKGCIKIHKTTSIDGRTTRRKGIAC